MMMILIVNIIKLMMMMDLVFSIIFMYTKLLEDILLILQIEYIKSHISKFLNKKIYQINDLINFLTLSFTDIRRH